MLRKLREALEIVQVPARKLTLIIGDKTVEPGDFIPKAKTHTTPKLAFSGLNEGKYITICIDPDAPFTIFPFLSPICHWLQTDLDRSLVTVTAPVIPYRGANPPPIARRPHRYVFMLFKQPDGFERQKLTCAKPEGEPFPMMGRMRFDFEGLMAEAELGEILAANWYRSL